MALVYNRYARPTMFLYIINGLVRVSVRYLRDTYCLYYSTSVSVLNLNDRALKKNAVLEMCRGKFNREMFQFQVICSVKMIALSWEDYTRQRAVQRK